MSRKILVPQTGLRIWTNPKNQFTVFECHYTADPEKRTPEWKKKNSSGMPIRDWNTEYEITWESWAGLPIFPDWKSNLHLSKELLVPHAGLPLLRGWDFGLTPAAIICQLVGEELWVLKEVVEFNMGAVRFAPKVIRECQIAFPRWSDPRKHWKDFIDPAGNQRMQTDEQACAMVLQGHGMVTIPGAVVWEDRRKSVEEWLTKFGPDGPLMRVNEAECPVFVKAMKGGYQYPKDSEKIEPINLRPLKNKFSHVADAFQMVTSMVGSLRHTSGIRVPTNSYANRGR